MAKLEAYDRRLGYSYCLGLYPSLTLIQARPACVKRLLLHPAGLEREGVEKLRDVCASQGIREEMAERVLRREAKKDNCFAALVFDKYEAALSFDAPHVVLNGISDGGNLGTALRACLGFGIRDVAVIRPCVDAFDPHVLRATMGAFYKMNVRTFDDFDAYRAMYAEHHLYPFMLRGAKPMAIVAPQSEALFSLVFGNEATGLPDDFARLGDAVFIEQNDDIDSLNLAVSVALGVYAFTAQGRGF